MMSGSNGGGPCGACKFLRRKCVSGCIFAPYFDSEQGTAHFAAVHKVFGASNASKLLSRIPAHKRLDAVVTLCYEALSRVRDPVYGCVGHIFTLQQQVVNLQAELAYVQARLATLQRLAPVQVPQSQSSSPTNNHHSSSDLAPSNYNLASMHFDHHHHHPLQPQAATSAELASFFNPVDHEEVEDGDVQALAREIISRYLPGVRFRPSSPDH
ncbi:LOB domain-containing protein 19 [Corylus avellana]|uniref:LOB domain-containing protein 19 n=1 Tax=Corylus avellana TaxID=13451 RepID=UPI00286B25E7|nr:LOB domain-containing protein 19 [Corylus avellana]